MARSSGSTSTTGVILRPITALWRLRARITLDMLVTLAISSVAIVLAVAYQLIGRWARRGAA